MMSRHSARCMSYSQLVRHLISTRCTLFAVRATGTKALKRISWQSINANSLDNKIGWSTVSELLLGPKTLLHIVYPVPCMLRRTSSAKDVRADVVDSPFRNLNCFLERSLLANRNCYNCGCTAFSRILLSLGRIYRDRSVFWCICPVPWLKQGCNFRTFPQFRKFTSFKIDRFSNLVTDSAIVWAEFFSNLALIFRQELFTDKGGGAACCIKVFIDLPLVWREHGPKKLIKLYKTWSNNFCLQILHMMKHFKHFWWSISSISDEAFQHFWCWTFHVPEIEAWSPR